RRPTIRVVNVVASAVPGRAARNRQRRGAAHEEASSAQRFATCTTGALAPGLAGPAVKAAAAATTGRARRRQYEPESGDSKAYCYCYQAYQHGTYLIGAALRRPRPF